MSQVVTWLTSAASMLYSCFINGGYIGLAIVGFPIMRKLCNMLKNFFTF